MKIRFCLAWYRAGKSPQQAFKSSACSSLLLQYTERIAKYSPCEISGSPSPDREPSEILWLCDRGATAKILSSEEVAAKLAEVQSCGAARLSILIGPPNGYSESEIAQLKPALRWSFGKLTLPHELAAVVAAEQLYRAWTILKREPYHLGH